VKIDECLVHWATIAELSAEDANLLTEGERNRMARFRQAPDRLRFACATVLARQVIGVEQGKDPRIVLIERHCRRCGPGDHGAPSTPGLFLSIAHAGTIVGVAMTRSGPVGLDVEPIEPGRTLAGVAEQVLGPAENAAGSGQLLRYWTRKEALVKATGDGIVVGLDRVLVTPPGEPAALISYPNRPGLVATLADLSCLSGHTANAAVLAKGPITFTEISHSA